MARASSDYINTGGGKLYIQPYVDGQLSDAEVYFGLTNGVSLSVDKDEIEQANTEGPTQTTAKKVTKKVTGTLKFDTPEISARQLARAYGGKIVQLAQTAKSGEEVALTVSPGYVYDLGIVNLTAITVTSADGNTTYTRDTDYRIDMGAGRLEILDSGAIGGNTDIKATVDADAFTWERMAAFKLGQLEARLVFVSEPQTGVRYKYTFKRVSIGASGELPLKSEEFAALEFEGTALADEGTTGEDVSNYFDIEEIPANS